MAATWERADHRLIEMAERVIRKYRPDLVNARIGFLFRSEASKSRGRSVIGKAEKVSAKLQALLDLDFLIWIAQPAWNALSLDHREALLHHELCHCEIDPESEECTITAHDIEEFHAVIVAHGLWRTDLEATARAIQPHLPQLGKKGKVVAVDPEALAAAAA